MNLTLSIEGKRVSLSGYPFKLLKKPNFSGLQADVNITQTGADGGLYLYSRYGTRDIEIEGMINCYGQNEAWVKKQKQLLFKISNPKEEVTIEIEEHGEVYLIKAYPTSFPVFRNDRENKNKTYQTFFLQLVAPDPYLYRPTKQFSFSTNNPLFEFPLEFNEVVFGERNATLIESIYNGGTMEAPIEIRIKALQTVTNPSLFNVYTQEQIKLNATLNPGDEVIINTGRKKEVSRIRNGVKENFFYALNLNSDFIQLHRSDNIFRMAADQGEEYMEISISYQERVGGI
ncbi:Phage tail protein [Mesobacillus persicus]|uniref:Phage tail protein n=1 Tax=Mesobacillus persicus TaxID=930146 RepID=A0A1H7XLN4_9BACI|nr:phage tail domain-containing protein [Mesobacillus persicus]SEM34676.1 Phage tail protein [Mesobacillus persicus]